MCENVSLPRNREADWTQILKVSLEVSVEGRLLALIHSPAAPPQRPALSSPLPSTFPSPPSTWSTRSASCLAPRLRPAAASPWKASSQGGVHQRWLFSGPRLGRSALPVSCFRRQRLWKGVAGCSRLTAAQTCDLTLAFRDPLGRYRARVRGYVSNLTSAWTVSSWFQPLTDSETPDSSCCVCSSVPV